MNGVSWISRGRMVAIITAVVCCSCSTSQAAFTSVTDRTALGGTDFIDWATVGSDYTLLTDPFTVTSNGGVAITGSTSYGTGPLILVQQGINASGNFGPTDMVLYNGSNYPLTIMFGSAVTAAGTQFLSGAIGNFDVRIDALAADGITPLATFFYTGLATKIPDNSAIFAGIASSGTDDFYGIRLTVYNPTSSTGVFAINRLDFTPVAAPVSAPAPAGLVLMLTGLPVLGFAGWTRRRTAQA